MRVLTHLLGSGLIETAIPLSQQSAFRIGKGVIARSVYVGTANKPVITAYAFSACAVPFCHDSGCIQEKEKEIER